MEIPGGGVLGRLGEKVLGWIALALLIAIGVGIWQMPAETKGAIWSGLWRSIVWLAAAAALPWSARLLIRRVLEQGTNWAGAALIGGYTLGDVVLGVLLMTGWPSGAWGWLACLGALGVAATYNYLVTEYVAEASGG
ncbi:MAG TPA: hypothetical protein PKC49_15770 [Phycisphaerae bacterium]|nr:hypothetical protein [Phycisphaerae bacterium]